MNLASYSKDVIKYLLFPEELMLMTAGGSWGDMPVAS